MAYLRSYLYRGRASQRTVSYIPLIGGYEKYATSGTFRDGLDWGLKWGGLGMKIDQVFGDGVDSWRDIEGYAKLVADRLESSHSTSED